MIRLHYKEKPIASPGGKQRYSVEMEKDGEKTDLPGTYATVLYEGSRKLLEMGISPDELVTTRSSKSEHDSWDPMRVGDAAKWTVSEGDGGIAKALYREYEGPE